MSTDIEATTNDEKDSIRPEKKVKIILPPPFPTDVSVISPTTKVKSGRYEATVHFSTKKAWDIACERFDKIETSVEKFYYGGLNNMQFRGDTKDAVDDVISMGCR